MGTKGELKIDGRSLTIDDVVDVARARRRVAVTHATLVNVARCRALVDVLLKSGEKVYGLTTGFGILREITISPTDAALLQENLIRSHAVGIGKPFPEDVVRAAILLRANTLCRGHSGVRVLVVQQLVAMLNDDVYPFIPSKGSVGCSGDLAPLSHLALVLMGDENGKYFPKAQRRDDVIADCTARDFAPMPAAAALKDVQQHEGWHTFKPIKLEAKEGLGLNNGTQFMTALAALTVFDARLTLRHAELAAAISLEANRGVRRAYKNEIHQARPQKFQQDVADRVIGYCKGSQIIDFYLNSGHLRRAKCALERAGEILAPEADGPSPAMLAIAPKLASLVETIEQLIQRDGAFADDHWIGEFTAMSARTQLDKLSARVAPVQRQVKSLLAEVENTGQVEEPGRAGVEKNLRTAIDQLSQAVPGEPLVQDDYSFRCFPQVAAGAQRALEHVADIVGTEINSATDNPLLFPFEPEGGFAELGVRDTVDPDQHRAAYIEWISKDKARVERCKEAVIGGGNFHGQPIATAVDYLAIGIAEIASIAERRIAHLIDEHHSRGLPPFLTERGGLNSGFMIPQYTAAALVSENKTLCHPASVDSIPTCANSEDHVSMGTFAARKCATVVEHVRWVVAIEILTAYQGLKYREPLRPGLPIRKVMERLAAEGIERSDLDRVLYPDMNRTEALLRTDTLLDAAEQERTS